MLVKCKVSMYPLVPDQCLARYQRERSWVMTRRRPVTVKSLRSLKSP